MSDNEDLLADDLGDHNLGDYNIDNEEEEQLLADDYERGESQNVPTSLDTSYGEVESAPSDFSSHSVEYSSQLPPAIQQYAQPETECVVPNIVVEIPNTHIVHEPRPTYAPYPDEHSVPVHVQPAITIEPPQTVPSDAAPSFPNGDGRERFISERPVGAQRLPQVRDIPDTLDKVLVPRAGPPHRGRSSWRNPMLRGRHHPYTHYPPRGQFISRPQFPHPRAGLPMRPDIRPEQPVRPQQHGPEPDRPMIQDGQFGPPMDRNFQNFQRFPNFRPRMEEPRPAFRPNFERAPFYRPFGPHIREVIPGVMPQVTIRQPNVLPNSMPLKVGGRDPEVRMLPVQLPNLPPGGLQGKKVLINPHFKGNFQPPEGLPLLPAYIPTRIHKSPPRSISPTLESKFGPVKDIDDAAERFIAEQRNALARAANRPPRRSPQRYIENTTIEIENDLVRPPPKDDDDLLRRQEEFINANRAGLRRRMRSPAPPPVRRSPERRRPRTRSRSPPHDKNDEDSEYRRKLREQESLRERVLRAKEVRRRKNAVALINREREQQQERDRERPVSPPPKVEPRRVLLETPRRDRSPELVKPDTTKKSPEKEQKKEEKVERERERSPVKKESEVNSTCESLTPPRPGSGALTPPLPRAASDDELELILDDIDDILSDDDDKQKPEPKPVKPKVAHIDLRSKLPSKSSNESKRERQKIVFTDDKDRKKEKSPAKAKSPPRRTVVTSTKNSDKAEKKHKTELSSKSRQRIIYENNKEREKEKQEDAKPKFSNRRVILQRKANQPVKEKIVIRSEKSDPSKPNLGIFSRAVRTAIGSENRIIIKKSEDPQVEYESDSGSEGKPSESEGNLVAEVRNLPHGMTDTRMKTLAGGDVQNLNLNKEERTAKISFKNAAAAENFKKKFNNKMVAASRLTVILR